MADELGDRMKEIEGMESDRRFLRQLPICARLDGKCFSSFTRNMRKPYDERFSKCMAWTTEFLVQETNARIGYTQSDEISLVFYEPDFKSQIFFDGRIQKMVSVLASMATLRFYKFLDVNLSGWANEFPVFDCRVWQVPNKEEACNVLLFREIDATKNSIAGVAQMHYSHKELFGKGQADQHEMLHAKGVNWATDFPVFFKRGVYFQRRKITRAFTPEELVNLPEKHEARKNPEMLVERHEVRQIDMPPFSKIINKADVVFEGALPEIYTADGKLTQDISEWTK